MMLIIIVMFIFSVEIIIIIKQKTILVIFGLISLICNLYSSFAYLFFFFFFPIVYKTNI